ncbi:MAG: ribonuclease HIII [Candidatus Zophobacter franzmannii]|nr:ribonuclease HIII [Candidatus Zophobacter franzmannii]
MINPLMQEQINSIKKLLSTSGLNFRIEKELMYGVKTLVEKGSNVTTFDLLYSNKKQRFSFTYKKGDEELASIAHEILSKALPMMAITVPTANSNTVSSTVEHKWNCWIGSDESGKGDFFGPLVTASFYCNKEDAKVLRAMGIADSKTLNDTKITELAKLLYKAYPNNINCIVLRPEKYNEVYQNMIRQGKKLNELLDWMHFRTIEKLLALPNLDGVLIDKYSSSGKLKAKLKSVFSKDIVLQPKAEADPAVAAASIIARYQFITAIENMNSSYKMTFKKGASKQVITAAKGFVKQYGKEQLHKVAKTHFKTMDSI